MTDAPTPAGDDLETLDAQEARRPSDRADHAVAEEALVASVLSDPSKFDDVADLVTASDFTVRSLRATWEAVLACDAQGRAIDVVTIADELGRSDRLGVVGGVDGLRSLAALAGEYLHHVEEYAHLVADRSVRRKVHDSARNIASFTTKEAQTGADALEFAEQEILGLSIGSSGDTATPIAQAVPAALATLANVQGRALLGHSTGFRGLDKLTSGVQGGQLIVVAARPGMGKSAMALQLAQNIASATSDTAAFYSYEMSTYELLLRSMASGLGVSLSDLRQGTIRPEQEETLTVVAQRLSKLPIVIDDSPPATIGGLRSAVRRLRRRGPLSVVIVDYLQLMSGERFSSGGSNRTQEVSEISRGLKLMARELNVGVIALSQLSRALEQRPNKRPMLSDLRESGSIEQDADTVWMLYRDGVYYPDVDPSVAELIVAKQRQGSMGTVHLSWDGPTTTFSDRPDGWEPPTVPLARAGSGREPF